MKRQKLKPMHARENKNYKKMFRKLIQREKRKGLLNIRVKTRLKQSEKTK